MAADEILRIGLEKVDFRHPTQVTDDTSILTLKNWVFEPLLRWESGGLARPGGCNWTFHIRDAVFHDGEPCLASHVIHFINSILESRDTFGMRWSYYRYFAQTKFTAVGERSVEIENPEPIPYVLDIFTEFYICRVAADGKPILGTGRYRVTAFDREEGRAVLDCASPRCEECQSPQRVIVTAEPNAETRLAQLRDGSIDAALNLERVEGRLLFEEDLQWARTPNTLSVMYYLNCHDGIFTSAEARLAVNHAVDNIALARDVFHNLAIPAVTATSPFHLGASEVAKAPIPYDVVEARRLLEGIDLSKEIILRTPTYMPERAEAISRFVAASLEAVGFKVTVEVEPDRPAYARQVGHDKRIGDMALFDSSPHSTFRVLDDKISSKNRAVWWQGFQDGVVDRLIEEANHAIEAKDRQTAYGKVLRRLRLNPPWLYLVHPVEVFAARLDVKGLSISCKGTLDIA